MQTYTDGPSFVMSRNGERLLMHQEANQALPFMVYLDASDSVLRPAPNDGNIDRFNFASASASDDGSRILLDARWVVDEQFAPVGTVSIPPYSLPFTDPALPWPAVLSPDWFACVRADEPGSFLGRRPRRLHRCCRACGFWTRAATSARRRYRCWGISRSHDNPSCLELNNGCGDYRARGAISLDGHTLFFVGNERLIVTPIPPEGTLSDGLAGPNGSGQRMKTQPWRLQEELAREARRVSREFAVSDPGSRRRGCRTSPAVSSLIADHSWSAMNFAQPSFIVASSGDSSR